MIFEAFVGLRIIFANGVTLVIKFIGDVRSGEDELTAGVRTKIKNHEGNSYELMYRFLYLQLYSIFIWVEVIEKYISPIHQILCILIHELTG